MTMLYFGSFMPVLNILVTFYFLIMYYLDKYLIMYMYDRSRNSDGKHIRILQRSIPYYLALYPFFVAAMIFDKFMNAQTWYCVLYFPLYIVMYIVMLIVSYYVENKSRKNPSKFVTRESEESSINNNSGASAGQDGESATPNSNGGSSAIINSAKNIADGIVQNLKNFSLISIAQSNPMMMSDDNVTCPDELNVIMTADAQKHNAAKLHEIYVEGFNHIANYYHPLHALYVEDREELPEDVLTQLRKREEQFVSTVVINTSQTTKIPKAPKTKGSRTTSTGESADAEDEADAEQQPISSSTTNKKDHGSITNGKGAATQALADPLLNA